MNQQKKKKSTSYVVKPAKDEKFLETKRIINIFIIIFKLLIT